MRNKKFKKIKRVILVIIHKVKKMKLKHNNPTSQAAHKAEKYFNSAIKKFVATKSLQRVQSLIGKAVQKAKLALNSIRKSMSISRRIKILLTKLKKGGADLNDIASLIKQFKKEIRAHKNKQARKTLRHIIEVLNEKAGAISQKMLKRVKKAMHKVKKNLKSYENHHKRMSKKALAVLIRRAKKTIISIKKLGVFSKFSPDVVRNVGVLVKRFKKFMTTCNASSKSLRKRTICNRVKKILKFFKKLRLNNKYLCVSPTKVMRRLGAIKRFLPRVNIRLRQKLSLLVIQLMDYYNSAVKTPEKLSDCGDIIAEFRALYKKVKKNVKKNKNAGVNIAVNGELKKAIKTLVLKMKMENKIQKKANAAKKLLHSKKTKSLANTTH